MSAVVERAASALPLLSVAQPDRVLAWRDGRPISVARFLADVHAVAATLPPARIRSKSLRGSLSRFWSDSAQSRAAGRPILLPPSRAPAAIEEVLAGHPGSYALGDAPRDGLPDALSATCGSTTATHARDIAVPEIDGEADRRDRIHVRQHRPSESESENVGGASRQHAQNTRTLTEALGLAPDDIAHIVATVPPQHMYGLELSILLPLLGPFAVHGGRPFFPADVAAALAEVPAPRMLVTTPIHLQALLRDPARIAAACRDHVGDRTAFARSSPPKRKRVMARRSSSCSARPKPA